MGGSGLFQIFLGAMDKESVRVVGGNKKGIIDASTLVYKYVFAAGAAADDFLSRGDLMRMATAWEAVVKHFHAMPTEWARRGCCRAQRTARPGTNMRF